MHNRRAGTSALLVFVAMAIVISALFIACSDSHDDNTDDAVGPWIRIVAPSDGDSVPKIIWVYGESSGITPGRFSETPPPWIYVVLKPIPGDPYQHWRIQPHPLVHEDGRWEGTIFAGLETDPSGTPYIICVIVSSEQLEVGRYGKEIPVALSRECIVVNRE